MILKGVTSSEQSPGYATKYRKNNKNIKLKENKLFSIEESSSWWYETKGWFAATCILSHLKIWDLPPRFF